ncbi:MAG TPA: selenide, water dikinase SelD [Stellaceae bacterium]
MTFRLTDLAHGGGCGCKLAPSVLSSILAEMPAAAPFGNLMVGTETADDAAVYRVNGHQAVVATTDFFLPIVDDPVAFGRIAAANALSDVYAMGGTPILALAILGIPADKLPVEVARDILAGGAAICAEAGIPVAGGHSIDVPEPIYGLAVVGLVDPARVLRNSTARAGDTLILTKRLGIGIYSAALKRGELDAALYDEMLASTTQLNAVGAELPGIAGVHAATDVTGFALLGHGLEMCRGAGLSLELGFAGLPIFDGARRLAQSGVGTGAAKRNWASYGHEVALAEGIADWQRDLLCDPQTSGGLLIACAPEAAEAVLDLVSMRGFDYACEIGHFAPGPARITVTAN